MDYTNTKLQQWVIWYHRQLVIKYTTNARHNPSDSAVMTRVSVTSGEGCQVTGKVGRQISYHFLPKIGSVFVHTFVLGYEGVIGRHYLGREQAPMSTERHLRNLRFTIDFVFWRTTSDTVVVHSINWWHNSTKKIVILGQTIQTILTTTNKWTCISFMKKCRNKSLEILVHGIMFCSWQWKSLIRFLRIRRDFQSRAL